jgi:opacity protein-like surface antigen
MHVSPRRRLAETFLLASAIAVASLSAPLGGARLRLPFEVFPGAIYLGLLAWPAFLGRGDGAEGAADLQLAAYGGPAYTMASAVKFTQSRGTDLRFGAVPWQGQPFKPPPYYGLRGILWPANGAQGLMADFTHIKAKAAKETLVEQEGTRDGLPVSPKERLSATFGKLEFTHGYNLFTLNLVRRSALRAEGLVAYAGAGAGVAIPHVEVGRTGWPVKTRTSEYQLAGPAVQVLGGMEWRFSSHVSLFLEYKLSCSAIAGDVKGGGKVETNLCTHQLLAGPAWHLKAPLAVSP